MCDRRCVGSELAASLRELGAAHRDAVAGDISDREHALVLVRGDHACEQAVGVDGMATGEQLRHQGAQGFRGGVRVLDRTIAIDDHHPISERA